MAFIHQGLRRLPQDRGELYEKCVEMLLKTWQEAKREEDDRAPSHPFEELGLHVNAQKDYLAHLALHLQEHGGDDDEARGLIARHDALACLVARHLKVARRTDPQLTEDRARAQMEDFLDYVSDCTGLLIDRGGGQLSFIHLSFQEYLAAWVFTCDRRKVDVDFFRQHLGDPVWEEVLLLRLHIILPTPGGGAADFDRIVRGLQKAGTVESLGRGPGARWRKRG